MERAGTKISKACEPCRRRKTRCNGSQPCSACSHQPSQCSYRAKARDRASARSQTGRSNDQNHSQVSGARNSTNTSIASPTLSTPGCTHERAGPEVYHGITATHSHGTGSAESAQLFYGPSSNFAFLQQLHRSLIYHGLGKEPNLSEGHEGGEGLDMFVQRSVFFGIPSRLDAAHPARSIELADAVSMAQASAFLQEFKTVTLHLLPLFTESELDSMLRDYFAADSKTSPRLQQKALTLAVLAVGALSTNETDVAEVLYAQAKMTAGMFDEAVTLTMIQFSILLADYQINFGRPNSAYIHLGTASRKALAMGLNREAIGMASNEGLEKRRSTMWCLYFHERWHAWGMGRPSALKMDEITCRFPNNQPVLNNLCEIARIAEKNCEDMYLRKTESLRLLYDAAQRTYFQLRTFAEKAGVGAGDMEDKVAALHLHQLYYHAVLVTFRPFLIAETLIRTQRRHGAMWLREACRHAIDAAQDSLVYISSQYSILEACKTSRFTTFFIESSCDVLLYDILWNPPKHAFNLEYINTGLTCLRNMTQDEPMTNAIASVSRILHLVEKAISNRSGIANVQRGFTPATAQLQHPLGQDATHTQQYIQFPSLLEEASDSPANNFIHFSDRQTQPQSNRRPQDNTLTTPSDGVWDNAITAADPISALDFDVLTTDLFNFFPVSLENPFPVPGTDQFHGMDNIDHR